MKNFKLIALIMLALVVALFSLASCSGNVDTNTDTNTDSAIDSTIDTNTDTDTDSNIDSSIDSDTDTDTETDTETDTDTDTDTDSHVHSYESVVTEPTCTEKGYTTYTCACGDSYTADETDAKGHKYESTVTAPTCTEKGYTTHTCACGDSYTDSEVAAKGHTFVDGKCACGADYVAPETEWTLVTELKNGDLVLIGASAYGKLLSAEKVSAGSYYNKGVDYSTDDFSKVTDAEIFVVTVNSDGTYTFTSLTGDVIALASSYSSLNKDGEHKSWALTDKGDGTFLVKNTGRNTYLEWYSSKGNWSTYNAGNTNEYYLSFYAKKEVGEHIHNHISSITAPTCTEAGYTTYTCACGDNYKVDGEAATGHTYVPTVTAPTCTEVGFTTYTCACGDNYKADETPAAGHKYVDGTCHCGEVDPSVHVHKYESTVTAPTCTEKGYTTHTCACGDSYTDTEVEVVPHVDTNLDITCDFEGCTKRILPAADSKISLFTANHMIIVSLSSSYYMEGVVIEVTDAKNGGFIIEDENGDTIYVRLPKNAEGTAYSAWTEGKVVVGDTIQIYGKPTRNTSSTPAQAAKVESGILTVLKHEHSFSEATCKEDGACACGSVGTPALGHIDENNDGTCDRCPWNMNLKSEDIAIGTDPKYNGVLDDAQTFWTWSGENFDAVIAKGTSTFTIYKTAKDYMQLKKQNTFTLTNKTDATIDYVVIRTTNASQLTNLVNAIGDQFTFTQDADKLTVTIDLDSAKEFTFSNVSTTTAYISGIEVVYEPAKA